MTLDGLIQELASYIDPSLPRHMFESLPDIRKDCNAEVMASPLISDSSTPTNDRFSKQRLIQMSSGNIAYKLKCLKDPNLMLAEAAGLTLAKNQNASTKQHILAETKTAAAYYKNFFEKNLSDHINNLVKSSKPPEVTLNQYALPANARSELESRLAD